MNEEFIWAFSGFYGCDDGKNPDTEARFTRLLYISWNRPFKMDYMVSGTYCALVHIVANSMIDLISAPPTTRYYPVA